MLLHFFANDGKLPKDVCIYSTVYIHPPGVLLESSRNPGIAKYY